MSNLEDRILTTHEDTYLSSKYRSTSNNFHEFFSSTDPDSINSNAGDFGCLIKQTPFTKMQKLHTDELISIPNKHVTWDITSHLKVKFQLSADKDEVSNPLGAKTRTYPEGILKKDGKSRYSSTSTSCSSSIQNSPISSSKSSQTSLKTQINLLAQKNNTLIDFESDEDEKVDACNELSNNMKKKSHWLMFVRE